MRARIAPRDARGMGAYLSQPVTAKASTDGSDGTFAYGTTAMQGWRTNMEVRATHAMRAMIVRARARREMARTRARRRWAREIALALDRDGWRRARMVFGIARGAFVATDA